ncbi:MAG: heparinase II/III family protein [Lentisphaeria bacterium]|nr:heparinase II/III family protein [Lentisphaeria bacterium]
MIRKIAQRIRLWRFVSMLVLSSNCVSWAGVERPMIWVKPSERDTILRKIDNHAWAKELFVELKARADAAVPDSLNARREKLLALPLVWPKDGSAPTLPFFRKAGGIQKSDKDLSWGYPRAQVTAIMKAQQDAIDCGVLHYLTGEEKYAVAAADILATFVNALTRTPLRTPLDRGGGNDGWLCDDHLLEARILGAQLPIIYDFVHPYLINGGKVYDLASGELRDFNFAAGQKVFRTYVDLALNRGGVGSNWPVLESSSLVQNMMALDDADERARLLPYFVDTDTRHQASLARIYRSFKQPGDIWPESLGYSKHVTTLTIFHMTLVDRIYPDLKLGRRFPNIPHSITAMYNLRYPNGDVPPFGDAGRHYGTDYLAYEMALQLAVLNQNTDQIKHFSGFLSSSTANGTYVRGKLGARGYGPAAYQTPLKLLWAIEDLAGKYEVDADPPRPRSNHLPHAGATIQRNISKTNPVKNSLMAVVAGGSFIHSHASGMDLELYGQGYVLGTDGGKGTYGTPLHENYYRLFAAHNTVISNGASAANGGWQNLGMDRVQPVVLEPRAGEPGVSPNHSFATTRFTDKHNLVAPAEHQRTVALIRLSDEHGYYLDVFRAKSDTPKQYHDYLYHNVGDRLEITANGEAVAMKDTPDRYQAAKKGERRRGYQHPGWHYFEDIMTSEPSAGGFKAAFTAENLGDRPVVMQAWVPAGLHAEMTQVTAPSSSVVPDPYRQKPLPTFLLRHHGEVWSNPFVVAYESHTGEPSVKSVERLMAGGVFKGVKVMAEVNGNAVIQYVLIQENLDDIYSDAALGIHFKGQFAILTVTQKQGVQSMYIGSGHELAYKEHRLAADGKSNAAYAALAAIHSR